MYFAQINGGGGSAISKPKDLHIPTGNTQKDNEIKDLKLGKDYFDIVIQDLLLNTEYSFQFAWKYEDGSYSEWSASKTFSTSLESAPAVPSQPTVTAGPGLINVTWNGNNAAGTVLKNYEKVNIYVGGTYKDSFFAAGTKSIPLAKGTYSVTLRSSSSTNVVSNATSPAVSATVTTDATDAAAALAGLDNKITISANTIVNASKQITDINAGGITVYSSSAGTSTSGNRIVVNSEGIAGFQSGSGDPSFAIKINQWTSPEGIVIPAGSAYFKGTVQSSSGTIGGFSLSSTTFQSTSSVSGSAVDVKISNAATQIGTSGDLSSNYGGMRVSKSGGSTSYITPQGFFVFPTSNDGSNQYGGAYFNSQFRIHDSTYGWDSITNNGIRMLARVSAASNTVGFAAISLNNDHASLVFRRSNTSYYIEANGTNSLDFRALRNIYVRSSAGNPTEFSNPSPGDIKLEW
jgi:hypothetical protein